MLANSCIIRLVFVKIFCFDAVLLSHLIDYDHREFFIEAGLVSLSVLSLLRALDAWCLVLGAWTGLDELDQS